MSWVTQVILVFGALEDENQRKLDVDSFFENVPHRVTRKISAQIPPVRVSKYWKDGGKEFAGHIYIGAYNYFPIDDFVRFLEGISWDVPDSTRLLVMDEDEEVFSVIEVCSE